MQSARISYITLAVDDLGVMSAFYSGLGFVLLKQSNKPDHLYTMYQSGVLILALYPKQLLAKQTGCEIPKGSCNGAMSLSLNVESQQAVDQFLHKAEMLGANLTKQGFEPAWGGYCGYFKDPEENLWEVVWHANFAF